MHIKKKIFVLLTFIAYTSQDGDVEVECPDDADNNVLHSNSNTFDRHTAYEAASSVLGAAISKAILAVIDTVLVPEDGLKKSDDVTEMKDGKLQMTQEILLKSGVSLGKVDIIMGKDKKAKEKLREGAENEEDALGECPASNDENKKQCPL